MHVKYRSAFVLVLGLWSGRAVARTRPCSIVWYRVITQTQDQHEPIKRIQTAFDAARARAKFSQSSGQNHAAMSMTLDSRWIRIRRKMPSDLLHLEGAIGSTPPP